MRRLNKNNNGGGGGGGEWRLYPRVLRVKGDRSVLERYLSATMQFTNITYFRFERIKTETNLHVTGPNRTIRSFRSKGHEGQGEATEWYIYKNLTLSH